MAIFDASVSPPEPIMASKCKIGNMSAEPHGAARWYQVVQICQGQEFHQLISQGGEGKNGAKCFFTPIGPYARATSSKGMQMSCGD